ncbi:hypothetical protein GMOD_00006123 [Pyrenophora seminiperda CCB06]|uniref:Uncharacterized protein n=1 Tax=Pyrenophora seminiperda CCB06 TaxID=1302712 RepID=A0A3M7M4E6_9PLEO|nr:hypothetical protein GMOD_00006123 [Pyrenophora seminiperda CCB06]
MKKSWTERQPKIPSHCVYDTHCCNDHQPVIPTKCLDHEDADITPEQARHYGGSDKGNVDGEQLGATVWNSHGEVVDEAIGLRQERAPKSGRTWCFGEEVFLLLRSLTLLPVAGSGTIQGKCIMEPATS